MRSASLSNMTDPMHTGLAPRIPTAMRLLILGSMPGVQSLQAQHYYAHPRNAFWPVLCSVLNAADPIDFDQRYQLLDRAGIGLWDVVGSCRRPGSLDQRIDRESVVYNDIVGLAAAHPQLVAIATNGQFAAKHFARAHWPTVQRQQPALQWAALPSTSPAHAGMSVATKQQNWATLRRYLDADRLQ